ncbi:MAG: hypothetical protein IV100_32180 [Myxococcales bacterium]|nr:hypothetical protein [Myxococcales bacterium]
MEWSNGLKGAQSKVTVANFLGGLHKITLEQPLFAGATQLTLGQWEFDELILVTASGGLASSTPTETLGVGLPSPEGILALPRPLVAGEFIELSSSICLRRGISERFKVKPKPAKIASPRIAEPVLDGAFAVFVFECEPDSTVVVTVDGAFVGSATAGSDGYATVPVSPSLGVGSRVAAQCQFGNMSSLPGPRVRVRALARLATPVIPAATYDTETSLLIVGVAPGAWLTVWDAEGRPFREVRAAETGVRISVPPLGITTLSCSASLGIFRKHSKVAQTITDPGLEEDFSEVKVGIFHLPTPVAVPIPDDVDFEGGTGGYDYTLGLDGAAPGEHIWRGFVEGRYYTVPDGGGKAKPVCVIIHGDDSGSDVVFSLSPVMAYEGESFLHPIEEYVSNHVSDILGHLGLAEVGELGRIANATQSGISTACLGYDTIGIRLAKAGCVVLSLNATGATTAGITVVGGNSLSLNCSTLFVELLNSSLLALRKDGLWSAGIPGTTADFNRTVLIGHSCGGIAVAGVPFESLAEAGIRCVGVVGLEPYLGDVGAQSGSKSNAVPCDVLILSSRDLMSSETTDSCVGQIVASATASTAVVQIRSGDHYSFSDYYSYLGITRKSWAGDTQLDFQNTVSQLVGVFVSSVTGLSPAQLFDSQASLPPSCRHGVAAVWAQPPQAASLSYGSIDSETVPDSDAKPDNLTSIGANFAAETSFNLLEGPDQFISIEFTEQSARLTFKANPVALGMLRALLVSTGGSYSHVCSRSNIHVMLEVSSGGQARHFRIRLSDFNRVGQDEFDSLNNPAIPKRLIFESDAVHSSSVRAIAEALGLTQGEESAHISLLLQRGVNSCSQLKLGPIVMTLDQG